MENVATKLIDAQYILESATMRDYTPDELIDLVWGALYLVQDARTSYRPSDYERVVDMAKGLCTV